MDAESRAAALRSLNRAGVKNPEAGIIAGAAIFYGMKKAEGLNAAQAEVALYRMLTTGADATPASSASSAAPQPRAAPATATAQPKADDADAVEESIETEIFAAYAPAALPPALVSARAHPGEISESVLQASVAAPSLVELDPGAALEACATAGTLSQLQLEGVLRAARRHAVVANGVRAGFFLGDGAGVGKGRQLAACILDGVARGRGRHIWFSVGTDLKVDAERDLQAVSCHVPVLDGCRGLDALQKKAFGGPSLKNSVLFATYATLVSAATSKKQSRLDQLVAWCGGPSFDGCVIFDEAHRAKNFDASNADASTKVSLAVRALQDKLPLARVIYASATGVSEIKNMAYAERLGLWGKGTSFVDFKDFSSTLEKRGVGALELLALELKSSGAYVSRGLAWQRCEFERWTCELDGEAVEAYDAAGAWWRGMNAASSICVDGVETTRIAGLRRALDRAITRTQLRGAAAGTAKQRFWGAQLRFFKELQTAAKVPFVAERAKEAVAAGKSVVIGLQSTGEAGLRDVMSEAHAKVGDAAPGLVAAARSSARAFVQQHFPVQPAPEPFEEPDEAIVRKILTTNRGPPSAEHVARWYAARRQAAEVRGEPVPELVALKEAILQRLDDLPVPPSPLDDLIDRLGGPDAVAEMTGRGLRVARTKTGRYRYEQRFDASRDQDSTATNLRERAAFQDGKKRVAIISDAASTGVSLHAAIGSKGEKHRRVHVTLELAWSADKSIQQLGRTHRSHQLTAPIYALLATDLGGEARFAAAVAKRLASLGALTKGDRRAASGQDLGDFDLDTKQGMEALKNVERACRDFGRDPRSVAANVDPDGVGNDALRAAVARSRAAARARSTRKAAYDAFAPYVYEEVALQHDASDETAMLAAAAHHAYDTLDLEPKKDGDVRLFLNRLQATPVADQNLLFLYFSVAHAAVVKAAKAAGSYDAGLASVRAASVVVNAVTTVDVDAVSGASTKLYELTLDRGASFGAAQEQLRTGRANARPGDNDPAATPRSFRGAGFYVSNHTNKRTGRPFLMLALRKANAAQTFLITRPNTGANASELFAHDVISRYRCHPGGMPNATDEERELLNTAWTLEYDAAHNQDSGGRLRRLGLLAGNVLPLWPALAQTVTERSGEMTKEDQRLRAVRVVLPSETIVGVRFPTHVLNTLRAALEQRRRARAAYAQQHVRAEPPTPVDAAKLRAATTPPKTIQSFFKKKSDDGAASRAPLAPRPPPPQRAPKPVAAKRRAAPVKRKTASAGGDVRSFFAPKAKKPAPKRPSAADVVIDVDADPWSCPKCTYAHHDEAAGFLQCAACGAAKEEP